PRFDHVPWYLIVGAIAVSTWVQAGEELGWRGYALPRMSLRLGLGPAAMLLGVLWATWHLPLFFIHSDIFGQSFTMYALQVVPLSVAMAWLYWRTNGSLLLVMLMHATVNNSPHLLPTIDARVANPFALPASLMAWLTAGLL